MKKIISAILICVICITSIPVVAFADDVKTDNGPLGVITDADGNIVEVLTMPLNMPTNGRYVDRVYTIPANGSLTTYQYEPKKVLDFCMAYYNDNGQLVTTRNGYIRIESYNSSTIGGTRYPVKSDTFSTNYEDVVLADDGVNRGWASLPHTEKDFDSSRPYYNAVYKNISSIQLDIRLVILMDYL